jgi:hypothetical protein
MGHLHDPSCNVTTTLVQSRHFSSTSATSQSFHQGFRYLRLARRDQRLAEPGHALAFDAGGREQRAHLRRRQEAKRLDLVILLVGAEERASHRHGPADADKERAAASGRAASACASRSGTRGPASAPRCGAPHAPPRVRTGSGGMRSRRARSRCSRSFPRLKNIYHVAHFPKILRDPRSHCRRRRNCNTSRTAQPNVRGFQSSLRRHWSAA